MSMITEAEIGAVMLTENDIRTYTNRSPVMLLLDEGQQPRFTAVYGIPVRYLPNLPKPVLCYEVSP